jgi:hypothetical protein
MISVAKKAALMRHWSARLHAFTCFRVLLGGLFLTGPLLLLPVLGVELAFSAYLPVNIASGFAIVTSVVRTMLVRHGWCAITAYELAGLSDHIKGEDVYRSTKDAACIEFHDAVGRDLLSRHRNQGMLLWSDLVELTRSHSKTGLKVEWFFIGRGLDQPASFEQWSTLCSQRARLDADSAQASGQTRARRL